MKHFFPRFFIFTLVFVFVLSLCSVLVPIQSFSDLAFPIYLRAGGNYSTISLEYTFYYFSASGQAISGTQYFSGVFNPSQYQILYVPYGTAYIGCTAQGSSGNRYFYIVYFYTHDSNTYLGQLSNSVSSMPTLSDNVLYDLVVGTNNGASNSSLQYFTFDTLPEVTPSPTPDPTSTPAPTVTPTPSTPAPIPIDQYFRPFRSFSGAYYNSDVIEFPDSVTRNRYEQYSGIVSNHNMVIGDMRTNLDFYDDKVVYKFDYDVLAFEADTYDFSFLYDADSSFEYVYVFYTINGQDYDGISISQSALSGTYTEYGAYDIDPSVTYGPPYYHWDYTLSDQKAITVSGIELNANTPLTLHVIVSSSALPHGLSSFDWNQFFQDTRPDNIFLTIFGGLASLPFFISGLSFLALGALIGIILKFMR